MLLWQGYPNLGLDDRSQFQLLESVPGGLEGLRGLVEGLQEAGVRVLLPYLPWDQGTSVQGDDIVTLINQVMGTLGLRVKRCGQQSSEERKQFILNTFRKESLAYFGLGGGTWC